MTSSREAAAWGVAVGTARGISHDARGLPNQDSVASQAIETAAGVVVTVADGHGHGRHFRSAAGSRLAVRTACAVAGEIVAEGRRPPWGAEQAGTLCDMLPEAIVGRWRESVTRDVAAHPYTPQELSALKAVGDGPEIPYGSTLLVALIAGDWLFCAQIGDGDLLAVRPDGYGWSPVGGDELLDGYRTTSLCQPGAVRSFRAAAHDLRAEPLLALLMSTDGYGNAQVKDPWQPSVAQDLVELAAGHDHEWFGRQVPVWAERCASAEGSGDDATIALLLAPEGKRPSGEAPVAEAERPPPGGSRPATRSAAPRASRRRAALAAAVVVAAGAVTGTLLATESPGSGRPPAPAGHASPGVPPSASRPLPPPGGASVKPRASGTAVPARAGTPTPAGAPSAGSSGVRDGTQNNVTRGKPGGTSPGHSTNQEG